MKKFLSFLTVAFLVLSLNAQQFNNSGFETWVGNAPQGWNSLGYMGYNLCKVAKSTDAHSGNFAIEVAPQNFPPVLATIMGMEETFVVPGFLTNATIDMATLIQMFTSGTAGDVEMDMQTFANLLTDGLALTEQPTAITGYYNFVPVDEENSLFAILGLMVAEIEGQRQIVGMGYYSIEETMVKSEGYQEFTMDLMNFVGTPATELIFLALVESEEVAVNFSSLFLDDVNVVYSSGVEALSFDNTLSVYPNPTSGDFRIEGVNDSRIVITNTLGQVVEQIEHYKGQNIRLNDKGVYFVRLDNGSVRKLIVE